MTSPHDRRLDRLAVIYRRGDPPGVDLARFADAEIDDLAALAIRRRHGGPGRDWTAAERATLARIEADLTKEIPMPKPHDGRIEYRTSLDVHPRAAGGRAAETVDGFEGYASTWWVVDSYQTAMVPGSFTGSIAV